MKIVYIALALISIIMAIKIGYRWILQYIHHQKRYQPKITSYSSSKSSSDMRSEVFDADSDTIVVDNSAN